MRLMGAGQNRAIEIRLCEWVVLNSACVYEDEIAEGDMVVLRWTVTGTHKAELMGIPPTNKRMMMSGSTMCRIASRKIGEAWNSLDALGMRQQLGVIPMPGQTG